MNALEEMTGDDILKTSFQELPRKYTTKTVNLCPYCRALVGAIITLPLLYLWRLLPHKKKKDMTIQEIRKASHRRSWIARGIGGGLNIALGIKNILEATDVGLFVGIMQVSLGLVFFTAHLWGPGIIKFIIKHSPKRKVKVSKPKSVRATPKFFKKLEEKHDVICPPIFFVDVKENEEFR